MTAVSSEEILKSGRFSRLRQSLSEGGTGFSNAYSE